MRLLEVGRRGDERRHQSGEVEVECGAPREAALEGEVGGTDRAAEVDAPGEGLGIEFKLRRDQRAAHAAAGDDGLHLLDAFFALGGLGVFLEEILAEFFGLRVGFGERPA